MSYEYITRYTSPNQNARPGGRKSIASITIHHWGVRGQKFQGVIDYLCRPGGKTSAHYVVEAGRVACIVAPDRRAWHSGNNKGNNTSIGIECRPEATDADYATVAELVRTLRAQYGNLPLVRHSDWKATACPGDWVLRRIDDLARGGSGPATPPAKPAPSPTGPVGLREDGTWGTDTTRALQARFGTTPDGRVSSQSSHWQAKNPGLGSGWGWVAPKSARGSQLIGAMQTWAGVTPDGLIGPDTIRAFQRKLGTRVDGVVSRKSSMVIELQKRLNAGTLT